MTNEDARRLMGIDTDIRRWKEGITNTLEATEGSINENFLFIRRLLTNSLEEIDSLTDSLLEFTD